jgi:hypothetical protein
MKNPLRAQWQDSRKKIYPLHQLTPMDPHADNRHLIRDVPSIEAHGLWYPILIYCVDLHWWNTKYQIWRPKTLLSQDPVINSDGSIWAVKMGSNRLRAAAELGYDSIEGIMCKNSDECVKLGRWYAQCDPLNKTDTPEYLGIFDYTDQLNK